MMLAMVTDDDDDVGNDGNADDYVREDEGTMGLMDGELLMDNDADDEKDDAGWQR